MYSILAVLKSLHHCVGRRLEDISKKYGVTGVQFMVLSYLLDNDEKDIFQKDIEQFLGVRSSTVTEILQNMTQKELITRISCAKDARLKKIVPCDVAKDMVGEIVKEEQALKEAIEKNITEDEKKIAKNIIEKIKQNLEGIEDERKCDYV